MIFCDLPTSNGEHVATEIGHNAQYIPANVTNESEVQKVLDEIKTKYGKLNVVVNCAGIANAHVTYNFAQEKPRNLVDFQSVLMVNGQKKIKRETNFLSLHYFFLFCRQM